MARTGSPQKLLTHGRSPVADRLHEAGFEPRGQRGYAAVWVRDPEKGEKIEFFVSHRGTARGRGSVRAIEEQPGLGGICLDGLWFMREYSRVLSVPAENPAGETTLVGVRVPLLGAFAVNKGVTFPQRSADEDDTAESKQGKDLLYVRDLIAAGSEVTAHIEREIEALRRDDGRATGVLSKAVSNLRLLRGGQWAFAVREAALMLVERGDQSSEDAAIADLRGHLDDFLDLLTASDHR